MKNLEHIREEIAYYGVEAVDIVDYFTVLNGKSLPDETVKRLKKLTIREIMSLSCKELEKMEGITLRGSERVIAGINLSKKLNRENFQAAHKINSPEAAMSVFGYLKDLEQEHFEVAFLDAKKNVIGRRNVFKGTVDMCSFHPREIFKEAIRINASGIIVAHNHPTGDPKPSAEDIAGTARLVESGKVLGIEVVDHIIVGDYYVSLREQGLM